MEWKPYIHSDPTILAGKPVIRGTRLSVEFIMQLKANGWTEDAILSNYPALSQEMLQASFAYAADCISDESIYSLHTNS